MFRSNSLTRLRTLLIVALLCLTATTTRAAPVALPSDMQIVQGSNGNFVTFRVAELLESDFGKKMPATIKRNVLREFGSLERSTGMRLTDIERLTVLSLPRVHDPIVVVTTKQPYDAKSIRNVVAVDGVEVNHRGKAIYQSRGPHALGVCTIDANCFLAGPAEEIRNTLDAVARKSDPLLADAVELVGKGYQVTIGTRPEAVVWMFLPRPARMGATRGKATAPVREEKEAVPDSPPTDPADPFKIAYVQDQPELPMLDELVEEMGPFILPYKPLLEAKSLAFGISFGQATRSEWKLDYATESQADDGEIALQTLLYVLRESVPQMMSEILSVQPRESPQLFALTTQIQTAIRACPVRRKGTAIESKLVVTVKPETVSTLLAHLEKIRVRDNTSNNLKQIGLAMHNYMSTHDAMPAAAITSKAGKPLLSWRVTILPYLDQQGLYNQFKLDEPWDSDHNKKLLAKMPDVYRSPNSKSKLENGTHFRVFSGPGTSFDPKRNRQVGNLTHGSRIADFQDGFSNSFLVVEAAEAVPWTKPEPLTYDPNKPVAKLGGIFPGGFHALHADGAVWFFKETFPAKDLRTMITTNDGIPLDWNQYEFNARPRPPRDNLVPVDREAPRPTVPDRP